MQSKNDNTAIEEISLQNADIYIIQAIEATSPNVIYNFAVNRSMYLP